MSLALNTLKLQAVSFDGQEFLPDITAELKLRLLTVKFDTEENAKKSVDILASCFGANRDVVKKYIDQLPIAGLYQLQVYLTGGDEALKQLNDEVKKVQKKEAKND